MPKSGALVALVFSLVFVPAAEAWTTLGSGLDNTVDPSAVVLANGKTLVAFREPKARAVVIASGASKEVVASGLASVGDPRLVLLRDGSLVLFVADQDGVVSYTSANGSSWSGPTKTGSADTGDVQAAAARADGTPFFTQDGTGFLNVYTGAASAASNVFPRCCGYAESVAVDSHDLAQVAFWSNAAGRSGYLYGKVDSGGLKTLSSGQTAENSARVPLTADASGNTFVGFANGYPSPDAFVVDTLRAGSIVHKVTLATGPFTGNQPLMALSVDTSGRVWAVWTEGGAVWAARSRSHGAHFGAAVHVAFPGLSYALEAAAQNDGSVEAIANDGSALRTENLLPGLTVQVSGSVVRVLDDGFPVPGATVRVAGMAATTDAGGRARFKSLPSNSPMSVRAAGYAPY